MKHSPRSILANLLGIALIVSMLAMFNVPIPVEASSPDYGRFPETATVVQTTADFTAFAAPGADTKWVVTDVMWSVLTAESSGTCTIEDAAGTPTLVWVIPMDTVATGDHINFSEGIECAANSAVMVDFSGSTGELSLGLVAYKERNY
jgi:hypothetical protein